MLGCKVRLNRKWIALAGLGSTLYRPLDGALNQIEFVRTKYKTDARLQIKRILNVSRLEVRSIRSTYNPVQIRSTHHQVKDLVQMMMKDVHEACNVLGFNSA